MASVDGTSYFIRGCPHHLVKRRQQVSNGQMKMINTDVQKFVVSKMFVTRLHLFDQKYSKHSIIMKYYNQILFFKYFFKYFEFSAAITPVFNILQKSFYSADLVIINV